MLTLIEVTLIEGRLYRTMSALFKSYIGHLTYQHVIRQLELTVDMPH